MPDLEKAALAHPLGWPFFGAGALTWLIPACTMVGVDLAAPLRPLDSAARIIAAATALTLAGVLLEFAARLLERPLYWVAGHAAPHALGEPMEAWNVAQLLRWQSPTADAEFARAEALVSFARVYLLHAALAGIAWGLHFGIAGQPVACAGAAVAGFAGVLCFAAIWYAHTRSISRTVGIAAILYDPGAALVPAPRRRASMLARGYPAKEDEVVPDVPPPPEVAP